MSDTKIITAEKVIKSFGPKEVVKGISLELIAGEIFGLLGANAAGKSTLAKIMVGELKPDSGKITYFGEELLSNQNKINGLIALVPQEEFFYKDFSVKQNLEFCGMLYGLQGKALDERTHLLLEWLNLEKFKNQKSKKLSGGYRRILNMACSLVHDPQIIFMDEPTVGLDPRMRRIFWEKILELKGIGKTIILTTHYMDEAEELCDRIALLIEGEIVLEGQPKQLIKKFAVSDLEEVFLKITSNVGEQNV